MRAFTSQPRAVFLLSFVEMWNRFSHFGMRALLVLFMVKVLHYDDILALGIFTAFCAVDKFGGIFGAFLAERYLGLRRAVMLGGWIVASGHLCLALNWFFIGLALLILGSCLFTTNIIAFVGNFYAPSDERRASGFTLFYMAINVGALLATLLCGFLAETLGWEYGFGLAAVGMVIGNVVLYFYRHLLDGKGEGPEIGVSQKAQVCFLLAAAGCLGYFILDKHPIILPIMPWITGAILCVLLKKHFRKNREMSLYLIAYILFIAAETQLSSSLLIFADRAATHSLFGIPVATSAILACNPITIISCGAMAALFLNRVRWSFLKMAAPFFLTAIAFFAIPAIHLFLPELPLVIVMLGVSVVSFAELMVSPVAYSHVSGVAAVECDPKITVLIPIGHAFGVMMGGQVGKLIAHSNYSYGFYEFSLMLLIAGCVLGALSRIKMGIGPRQSPGVNRSQS